VKKYTETIRIRTVIREEPIKLAQYIRGKTPKFLFFHPCNHYRYINVI